MRTFNAQWGNIGCVQLKNMESEKFVHIKRLRLFTALNYLERLQLKIMCLLQVLRVPGYFAICKIFGKNKRT